MPANIPFAPPRLAWQLGLAGLLPFALLTLMVYWGNPVHSRSGATVLVGYGATIVSFLGAIHWGLVMREPNTPSPWALLWGVVPSLLGWAALVLPLVTGLWLLVVTLLACFVVDRKRYPGYGLGGWLRLRLALTLVATLCCAGAAWHLA